MNILDAIGQTTIDKVESERPVPRFEPGDTLRVHVKVQEGSRERLVSRERPGTMEPECFDAVGTASVVPVRLFIEEQRAAGAAEDRIKAMVEEGYRKARFKAARDSAENPARRKPTALRPRARGGLPSVVKNGSTSCTILDLPPTIA